MLRQQIQALGAAVPSPSNESRANIEFGVFRQVENVRIAPVNRIAIRMLVDKALQELHRIRKEGLLQEHRSIAVEILAKHVTRKGNGAAGMLFFTHSVKVRSKTDLRFDFFLAVAVIVIGNDRDHHPTMIAARHFERASFVVGLVLSGPAHALVLLRLGRFRHVRQPQRLLGNPGYMRGNDHAPCVAGPVLDVESGVVLRQIRVAPIAENAFDEIEIAYKTSRSEEANLHGLCGILPRRWANQRPQEKRHPQPRLVVLTRCEWQHHQIVRRTKRGAKQRREDGDGNRCLVGGYWKTAFSDVKDSFRRTAIALRVVKDALR